MSVYENEQQEHSVGTSNAVLASGTSATTPTTNAVLVSGNVATTFGSGSGSGGDDANEHHGGNHEGNEHGNRTSSGDATEGIDREGHSHNDHFGQVYRLYQAAFNRTPDQDGLSYWTGQADSNQSLSSIATGFAQSAEFHSTYGNMSNHEFVDQLYQNILHRGGDAAGLAYWYSRLDGGQESREQILVGFSESNENQQSLAGVIQNATTTTTNLI